MAMTSSEPLSPPSLQLYSDGAAVSLAVQSGTTAHDREGVAIGITVSLGTTIAAAVISVAAAFMKIAQDGGDRDGASGSITAASGMTVAVTTFEQVAMPVLVGC